MLEYEQQSTLTLFRRGAILRDEDDSGSDGMRTYRDDEDVIMIQLRDRDDQIIRSQPLVHPEVCHHLLSSSLVCDE